MDAQQAPLSMEFSRQEYWNGLPLPFLGYLPDPGTEPGSPALQADSLLLSHEGSPKTKQQSPNFLVTSSIPPSFFPQGYY